MNAFKFSVLYVWCKNDPDKIVSIWGFPVTSGNLPWALLGLSILTGGSPMNDLIGIAAGHTYIFLKVSLPNSHGYDLLKTPKFIQYWTNEAIRRSNAQSGNARVFGAAGERVDINPDVAEARHRAFQGRGVRLGG